MVLISAMVKLLSGRFPVSQILLFRYVFAAVPLLMYSFVVHGAGSLRTSRYRDHGIRSASGILSLGLFYTALAMIPLAETTMLVYSSPIFVVMLSVPFLGEKIGLPRWSAVIVGFMGVMIISQPGTAVFSTGGLVAIGSAVVGAFVLIWQRRLSDTENTATTAIIYNTSGGLVFAVWTLAVGWTATGNGWDLALLVGIGLLAAFQQFFFTAAFRFGEASLLAPFGYLIFLFAGLAGVVFWNEVPPWTTIAGGMVIVASGLVILFRERVKRKPVAV